MIVFINYLRVLNLIIILNSPYILICLQQSMNLPSHIDDVISFQDLLFLLLIILKTNNIEDSNIHSLLVKQELIFELVTIIKTQKSIELIIAKCNGTSFCLFECPRVVFSDTAALSINSWRAVDDAGWPSCLFPSLSLL